MRRTLSIPLSLVLLALCAGCQRAGEPPVPAPPPQEETAEPADAPEPAPAPLLMPDGETVSSAEALEHQPGAPDGQESYRFDFAFLRYRQPVYETTLTRPGLVSDGCFRLGNREESELDLTGILPEDGRFVWVRVILEDIHLNCRAMTGGAFAVAKMTELEELAAIGEPGD